MRPSLVQPRMVYADYAGLGEYKKHLRQGREKRAKRGLGCSGRGRIPNRVGIEARPAEADEKQQVGHFEGDTVVGKGSLASQGRSNGNPWRAKDRQGLQVSPGRPLSRPHQQKRQRGNRFSLLCPAPRVLRHCPALLLASPSTTVRSSASTENSARSSMSHASLPTPMLLGSVV